MATDDALLIELVRSGSEDAAAELFERHWPLVWHWAFGVTGDRGLAEQVAQEAIFRAFRSLDRFDPARPFRAWLKRVTINLAIDELRRERRHDVAPEWMTELRAVPPFEDAELLESVVAAVREAAAAAADRRRPPLLARLRRRGDRVAARDSARHRRLPPEPRASGAARRAGGGACLTSSACCRTCRRRFRGPIQA
jgi:RNA polymerase sigma factor (sigma-70 family)